jgi:nitroreductase
MNTILESGKVWNKTTEFETAVHPLIQERKSRRAYAETAVTEEIIRQLFEAARWAPSSMNEQPWAYVYATKHQPELFGKIFEALNPSNQVWVERAPLLIVSLVRKNYIRNNLPNGSARYDVGAANAFLSLQATHLGLNVHQMGGFSGDVLKRNLSIPDQFDVAVIMAVGYPGELHSLSAALQERETKPRERYVQNEFVMSSSF